MDSSVPTISFEISHLGELREFTLPVTITISDVRSMYQDLHRERLDRLSYKGKELGGSQRLGPDCGLQSGDRLIGDIKIVISERDSERQTLLEANDSISVEELMKLYSTKERRKLPEGSVLLGHQRQGNEEKQVPLDMKLSLWSNGIHEESQLTLVTPEISVRIREKIEAKEELTLRIFDHYKARQLKELINQMTPRPLGMNDKLLYKSEELNDGVPVYKVGIEAGALIIIEREDITQERFEYICADCGSDVRLTRTDAVRCRECGNRIVFKKRTKKPCQYLAR
jgi:DNA-directed RNA polymerase I, II, and III subunit RPABC4